MRRVRSVALLTFRVLAACFATRPGSAEPSAAAALRELGRRVAGFVVWESNRTGAWELYRINTDGSGFKQITHLADVSHRLRYGDYLRPRVSPDGRTVLFAYADRRGKPVEAWLVPSKGGKARSVTRGNPLNWSADGRAFFFVRDHKVCRHELAAPGKAGAESPVHAVRVPADGKRGNMVGAVRADLKAGVFRTGKNEYMIFDEGKVSKTTGGCEPGFTADGRFMYWVEGPRDFRVWDTRTGDEKKFFGKPPVKAYDYTYFPTVSGDRRWLAYGASPSQHDHNTSDYEVFVQELDTWKPVGGPVRLSWDKRTDRWPHLYVHRDETPPTAPRGLAARADGQRVALTWQPSREDESGIRCYKVYRDGREIARPEGGTRYTDASADAGARHSYCVSAVNTAGLESARSKLCSVLTGDSPPSAPDGMRALPGNGTIRLTWSASREKDVERYRVFRAAGPGGTFRRLATAPGASFVDTGLENGKAYYYRIAAVDRAGHEGAKSPAVRATPGPRAAEGLVALYTFREGEGDKARSESGAEARMELVIRDRASVRWLRARNGVEFTGPGMIVCRGTEGLFDRLRRAGRLTIEAWIEPQNLSQAGPARIVSMSADTGQRDFTLGQDRSSVAFRLRTTRASDNGIPQLDTAREVLTRGLTHVVCTFDGEAKHVYVNGKRRPAEQKLGGDFSRWKRFPLVIGNEATGDRPWRGKIFLVALYDRALGTDEILRNYHAGCEVPRAPVLTPGKGGRARPETRERTRPPEPRSLAGSGPRRAAASKGDPVPYTGEDPVSFTLTRRVATSGNDPVPFTGD